MEQQAHNKEIYVSCTLHLGGQTILDRGECPKMDLQSNCDHSKTYAYWSNSYHLVPQWSSMKTCYEH